MIKEISFQGASFHTQRKEYEIEGVSCMRFNQMKSQFFKYHRVLCADIFCGSGSNVVGGDIVYGSPIRLLDGYKKANNQNVNFKFWFSDIRPEACGLLKSLVLDRYGMPIDTHVNTASDAVDILGNMMEKDSSFYLYLIVDPNGPKDFPKLEIEDLLSSFSKRIDVIPYISATAINRSLGARNKAGRQLKGWMNDIENFDDGFVSSLIANNRRGWIRKPIESDIFRWTMIPTFGCMPPKYGWSKQGYIDLNTTEGESLIDFYCGGNK